MQHKFKKGSITAIEWVKQVTAEEKANKNNRKPNGIVQYSAVQGTGLELQAASRDGQGRNRVEAVHDYGGRVRVGAIPWTQAEETGWSDL